MLTGEEDAFEIDLIDGAYESGLDLSGDGFVAGLGDADEVEHDGVGLSGGDPVPVCLGAFLDEGDALFEDIGFDFLAFDFGLSELGAFGVDGVVLEERDDEAADEGAAAAGVEVVVVDGPIAGGDAVPAEVLDA